MKQIKLSDKLKNKVYAEFSEKEIKELYSFFHKYNMSNYAYQYVVSWLHGDKNFGNAIKLNNWITDQLCNPIIETIAALCVSTSHDKTMQNILRYWMNGGTGKMYYKTDRELYGIGEHWADVEDVLTLRRGDCEQFMTLCFLTAIAAGIPEYRLYCTIGHVIGGGHAYLTYISDNLVMFPIDGCYWQNESVKFTTPYFENPHYLYGEQEWARFNTTGTYKIRG